MIRIPGLFWQCQCCGRVAWRGRFRFARHVKLCAECCERNGFRTPADYRLYEEIRRRQRYLQQWR